MVDPDRFDPMDASRLRGHALTEEMLVDLYDTAPEGWLSDTGVTTASKTR